jgi:nicotinamide-nucleotide amidase
VLSGIIPTATARGCPSGCASAGSSSRTSIDRRRPPDDLRAALDFLAGQGVDLIITSGGLGPTADDLTAEVVAEFAGAPLVLDEALEGGSARSSSAARPLAQRRRRRDARGQPQAGAGAARARRARARRHGAPASSLPPPDGAERPAVLVLPGPPRELQPMWGAALDTPALRTVLAARGCVRATDPAPVRDPGVRDRALAARDRGRRGRPRRARDHDLLRRGELEIATVFEPAAAREYERFEAAIVARHGDNAVQPPTGRRSTSRWRRCCSAAGAHDRRLPSRAPAG